MIYALIYFKGLYQVFATKTIVTVLQQLHHYKLHSHSFFTRKLTGSVQRYTGIFYLISISTYTGSNCKNIKISCIDLKTSSATLNLQVHDAGLIQVYTLNYFYNLCIYQILTRVNNSVPYTIIDS